MTVELNELEMMLIQQLLNQHIVAKVRAKEEVPTASQLLERLHDIRDASIIAERAAQEPSNR
ncbi:MAG TPA: hypothetical protein VGM18_16770 [Candidatus Sulfotelmatobacter sp.]|jgi:hypothetical protein